MVHTRTAIDEAFGRSVSRSISANADAPLPYGPGGSRFLIYSATAGLSVRLQRATYLREGSAVYTIYNNGSNTFTVTDFGGNSIQSVTAGAIREFHLLDNSTANGSWVAGPSYSATAGTPLTIGRVPMTININSSQDDVNLRTIAAEQGYAGDYPLALKVEIASGCRIGQSAGGVVSQLQALDTGVFFPGTTILLINRGLIEGRGGSGGLGGQLGGAGYAGGAGGRAVYARHSVTVVNLGTIAGGGGGGGGGGSTVSSLGGGGGGGGGQGYLPGGGGNGLSGGANGQSASGTLGFGGSGGSGGGGRGGDGGPWGSAGSAGTTPGGGGAGGAGGAAGYSLQSAGGGPVITKLTAGLIYGPEVLT